MPTEAPPQRLLSFNEAADRLGVSYWTVRRLCDSDELPFVRIRGSVRIDQRDLDAYIEGLRRKGEAA